MNKKTVEDIDVSGKKVLLRCDFNVPLDMDDKNIITDDKRIVSSLETINYLIDHNAKVILCSHLGKTGENLSLTPVAKRLKELLKKDVPLLKETIGENVKDVISKMNQGDVVLIENVRMFKEEELNDPVFSKELASLAEIYVNDAFGSAHRAHASTVGVTTYLPSVSGFLIKKELDALNVALNNPKRPFVAILGGSKVSSKITVIKALLEKVDTVLIGGGMTYTFVKALGGNIGNSICELDKLEVAREILETAKQKNVRFILAVDTIVADHFSNDANTMIVSSKDIPEGFQGMDIGPETIKIFDREIKLAGTVLWNGPVGVFEFQIFQEGSRSIAESIAESECISIIGGGDSAAAVEKFELEDKMTHVSTGGGATLEFIEGKDLPGISALNDK